MQKDLFTDRLHLRTAVAGDLQALFELRSDPEVSRYIKRPGPNNLEEVREFLDRIWKGVAEGRQAFWVISPRESRQLLGTICLWNFSGDRLEAEVGYDMMPAAQGNGYMTESLEAVLNFSFDVVQIRRLEAYTHADNMPSVRLLRRFGFKVDPDKKDADDADNVIFYLENE